MIGKTSSLESGSRAFFMLMEYKKNENDGVVSCGNEIVEWKIIPHSQGHVDASKFDRDWQVRTIQLQPIYGNSTQFWG